MIQILEPHLWWERAYHTMMITGYDRNLKTFTVSYHTIDQKDVNLTSHVLSQWPVKNRTKLRFYHITEGYKW